MDDKALKKLEAAAEFEKGEADKADEALTRAREKALKFEELLTGVSADVENAETAAAEQHERAADAVTAHDEALAQYRAEHDGESTTVMARAASVGVKGVS